MCLTYLELDPYSGLLHNNCLFYPQSLTHRIWIYDFCYEDNGSSLVHTMDHMEHLDHSNMDHQVEDQPLDDEMDLEMFRISL